MKAAPTWYGEIVAERCRIRPALERAERALTAAAVAHCDAIADEEHSPFETAVMSQRFGAAYFALVGARRVTRQWGIA